jgi:hypothetical protein
VTKDKDRRSAKRLLEEARADPAYRARLESKLAQANRVLAAEQQLLHDLATMGYRAESLQALIDQHAPLPAALAEALVQRIQTTHETSIQESLVRALGAARAPFDVQPLLRLFEETNSEALRWAIANTFAEVRPLVIRDWLLRALQSPATGRAREMLALAVARTSPAEEANRALLGLIEELPGHVAIALGESGGPKELALLQAHLPKTKGWVKKEIEKAMRKIAKRLAE